MPPSSFYELGTGGIVDWQQRNINNAVNFAPLERPHCAWKQPIINNTVNSTLGTSSGDTANARELRAKMLFLHQRFPARPRETARRTPPQSDAARPRRLSMAEAKARLSQSAAVGPERPFDHSQPRTRHGRAVDVEQYEQLINDRQSAWQRRLPSSQVDSVRARDRRRQLLEARLAALLGGADISLCSFLGHRPLPARVKFSREYAWHPVRVHV
jgi:hypothetical protein